MSKAAPHVDSIFRALGDPTRRAVVERLGRGPASVTELAAPFQMSLPSFFQHLKVLEEAGLVTSQKQGRVRTFELSKGPLREVGRWLDVQRALWERRLDQLDAYLVALHAQEAVPPPRAKKKPTRREKP